MNSVKSFDGNASERDVLVDDIQRIREVLHLGGDKLSSDDEEEDSEEGELDDEENPFRGSTPGKTQNQREVSWTKQNGRICSLGDPDEEKQEETFDILRRETVDNSNQCIKTGNGHCLQEQHSVFADEHMDMASNVYTLTELQPVKFQHTDRILCTSQTIQNDPEWDMELTINLPQENQTEKEEQAFSVGADMNDDTKMKWELQKCLESNRDYQLAVLDELDRIELALAKNREKQLGLHQMRASREEIKAEPHTLFSFCNPYFRDKHGVGPPDNEDTKSQRQNSQVGGYELPAKTWTTREKKVLAEGVRMQNLESKLSPVLQKIRKLESKKPKTAEDLKELEDLHSEKTRIKNIPVETLERDLDSIDWDRISSSYLQKRSGFECRLRWCNFGHPDVNLTPWTKEEDKVLIQLAKSEDTWDVIAQKLQTNRTPIHCYQRYQRSLNKNLLKSKWTPEDDHRLLEVVRVVGEGHWSRVAGFMDGRMGDQCMHRYMQTLKLVKKGKWSKEEDELLKKAVSKFGPANWYKMAELVPERTGSQCRERWVNALDPKINKGDWTEEQDNRLITNVEKFGKGNWAKIARAQGDRTDNQCWRRWIVLRKEDSLHYRQNILRKRRELVANFTGRKQERPSLQPEDLDIPDLPVVRKHNARHHVPPEESQQRRRLTRQRYKEKELTEEREAEEIPKERTPRTRRVVRYVESSDSEEDSDDLVLSDSDDSNETETSYKTDGSSSSDEEQEETKRSSHRPVRKTENSRSGAEKSHQRVITESKHLSSRKEVVKKRQQRILGNAYSDGTGGESEVPVSGTLAPFSLLLQAFSIDIPTVLQSIQRSSSAQSLSPSPTGTDATATQGTHAVAKTVDRVADQSQGNNGFSSVRTSSVHGPPQDESNGVVPEDLRQDDGTHSKSVSEKGGSDLVKSANVGKQEGNQKSKEKDLAKDLSSENEASPDTVKFDRNTNKDETPVPNTHAQKSVKTPLRRAPIIPPLPPCCTTLKTFRSLQQLRPHLEQLAAMLHGPRGENAIVSRPTTCPTVSLESSVNVTHENVEKSRESVRDRHVVPPEWNKDGTEPNHKDSCLSSHWNTADNSRRVCGGGLQNSNNNTESLPAENPLTSRPVGSTLFGDASPSGNDSSCVEVAVATAPAINLTSNHGSETTFASLGATKTAEQGMVQNSDQRLTGIGMLGSNVSKSLYQNTYGYKLLSSRFNSLFLWPALLSKVSPHIRYQTVSSCHANAERSRRGTCKHSSISKGQKRKSQMGDESTPFRRKQPGLAAVRMASSASMGTVAQQMITEGSVIRPGAITRRAAHTSSIDSSAGGTSAARLIGMNSRIVSTDSNDPVNTRKSRKKTAPLETRRSSRIKAYSSRQTCEYETIQREGRGFDSSQNEKTTDLVSDSNTSSLPKSRRPTTPRSVMSPPASNSPGFSPKRSRVSPCTRSAVSNQNTVNLRCRQTVSDQEFAHDSETADTFSDETADRLSPRTRKNVALSPGSSKRKTSTPRRRAPTGGARWTAMFPSTEEEEDSG